jgi:ribosomal protein S18 acetylase RimI-like enzyme
MHEHDGLKYGVFDEVNTSPAYRRRGIAQALITHMLAEFASQGCTEARLHTDAGNRMGARSLYEKLGFVTVKTFPRYRKSIPDEN